MTSGSPETVRDDAPPELQPAVAAAAVGPVLDQALATVDAWVSRLPHGAPWLIYKQVLLPDPRSDLLTAVLLTCHGARVSVAGATGLVYDEATQGPLYRALLERLAVERPHLDPEPITEVLAAKAFVPRALTALEGDLEDLAREGGHAFDLVVSDGLLTHTASPLQVVGSLSRVTALGGVGVHRVTFGDPSRPDGPLDHLTESAHEFEARRLATHGHCGSRWRPSGLAQLIESRGFAVLSFDETQSASDSYLDDLLTRLHADHADLDRHTLRPLAGCFLMRRRATVCTEFPLEDDHPQTLAHSACRYAVAEGWVRGRSVLDVGCGAGLGTRRLLAAGAERVVGLDRRPEALALARAADPRGPEADGLYLEHDLEHPLPFPDESADVAVALEVLEHVDAQGRLLDELHRVLRPDGVAFVSVPHAGFEAFWNDQAGESNRYHVRVPELEEFLRLLTPFAEVKVFGQVDVVASVVLPLGAADGQVSQAELEVDAARELSERGTVTVIARCHKGHAPARAEPAPKAFAFGNHQESYGGLLDRNRSLAREAEEFLHGRFAAENALRWRELADREGA
jgi:SAM-dependent methyltransferase